MPQTMAAIPLGGPTNLAQQASQDFLDKRMANAQMWKDAGATVGSVGQGFGSAMVKASNQPAPAMSSFGDIRAPQISAGTFDPRDLFKFGDGSGTMDTTKLLALLKKNSTY